MTRADWTDTNERRPESPRSSSCMMSPYAMLSRPGSPYSEMVEPNTWSSARPGTSSFGKRPSQAASSMMGRTLSSTKSPTVSRTSRCSSVSRVSKSR